MTTTPPVSNLASTRTLPGETSRHPELGGRAWFAAYTAPRHEKFVQAQLTAKRVQSFLPTSKTIRRWNNGVRREVEHPLFPGYIFVCLGPGDRLAVLQTSGVVYILGNGKSPIPLEDHEVLALRVGAQRASLVPHPFLCTGDKVCITRGPFHGVKGCVQQNDGQLTLVVTIQLLQKSFGIHVNAHDLELAG